MCGKSRSVDNESELSRIRANILLLSEEVLSNWLFIYRIGDKINTNACLCF